MDIVLSVACCAYNHEKYIRDALEGFVSQKTDFPFEVLVHDDASTDGTADIIREYEAKYPNLIKAVYQTENQYSKGIQVPMTYLYPLARGKYIALCEGDDYWTDPLKLQRQVDALEAHPEADICACTAEETERGFHYGYCAPAECDTVIPARDVILGGGTFVATCSIVARRSVLLEVPEFRGMLPCDYTIQIQGSLRGGMVYLADCMCVYRRFSAGSWTARFFADPEKQLALDEKMQNMLLALDRETEGKYSDAISYKLKESKFYSYNNRGMFREMLSPELRVVYGKFPLKGRIKIRLRCLFPWAFKLYRSIRRGSHGSRG